MSGIFHLFGFASVRFAAREPSSFPCSMPWMLRFKPGWALHHLGVLHCEYALLAACAIFWTSTGSTGRISQPPIEMGKDEFKGPGSLQ